MTVMTHPNGKSIKVNNPETVATMQSLGYTVGKPTFQQFNANQARKDMYKPGYDVRDFKNISFTDYMSKLKGANSNDHGFLGNLMGMKKRLQDEVKHIQDKGMVQFDPKTDQAWIDNKIAEMHPERAYGLDYTKDKYISDNPQTGVQMIDDGFGGKMAVKTYQSPNIGNQSTFVVTGPPSSADGGYGRAVVPGTSSAVVPQNKSTIPTNVKVKPKLDLNEIARNYHGIGVEEPQGEDMPDNKFGYHKKQGQNFWTVNNNDSYWNDRVMGTGNHWSHADKKAPVKELDTQAISNWAKKFLGMTDEEFMSIADQPGNKPTYTGK